MKKSINLDLTKSLVDFDTLLGEVIAEVSIKEVSEVLEQTEKLQWKFQVGKYVAIKNDVSEEYEESVFWIGFDWGENEEGKKLLWLEFDAKTCSAEYWDKLNELIGSSGEHYSKVDLEFSQVYMNAWIHFYLKDEYLGQFFDGKSQIDAQRLIVKGFIEEVLSKL